MNNRDGHRNASTIRNVSGKERPASEDKALNVPVNLQTLTHDHKL